MYREKKSDPFEDLENYFKAREKKGMDVAYQKRMKHYNAMLSAVKSGMESTFKEQILQKTILPFRVGFSHKYHSHIKAVAELYKNKDFAVLQNLAEKHALIASESEGDELQEVTVKKPFFSSSKKVSESAGMSVVYVPIPAVDFSEGVEQESAEKVKQALLDKICGYDQVVYLNVEQAWSAAATYRQPGKESQHNAVVELCVPSAWLPAAGESHKQIISKECDFNESHIYKVFSTYKDRTIQFSTKSPRPS